MTQRPPCASPGTVASEGGEAGPSGGGEYLVEVVRLHRTDLVDESP